MKPHILIVDDDQRIVELLKKFFLQNNFLVSIAYSVEIAEILIEYFMYDLVILDVMLPRITGLEFARKIKSTKSYLPIVMLTALSEPVNRVKGLESGASDYLTKPFEPQELLIRVNNLIKTHQLNVKEYSIKRFGSNCYNLDTKKFFKSNVFIKLSTTEQKLLEVLINKEGCILSRIEISKIMGGISLRSIDVQIMRVRNKIEDNPKNPKYLKTIRNNGYALYI